MERRNHRRMDRLRTVYLPKLHLRGYKEWKLLQITQTIWLLPISDGKKCLSSTTILNEKNIYQMCTKWKVHIFNEWTIILQSLKIKKWKLFELQITQTRHHLSILRGKFWVQDPKNEKKSWNVYKIEGAHLQCVNTHYAKLEYKKRKL